MPKLVTLMMVSCNAAGLTGFGRYASIPDLSDVSMQIVGEEMR